MPLSFKHTFRRSDEMRSISARLVDPHTVHATGHMGMYLTLIGTFSACLYEAEKEGWLYGARQTKVDIAVYADGIEGNSHLRDLDFGFPLTMRGYVYRNVQESESLRWDIVGRWDASIYGKDGIIRRVDLSIPDLNISISVEAPNTPEEMVQLLTTNVIRLLRQTAAD